MELYQLKTFVAVAEEEHLTRAAERLHVSQPAVSAHVKALEEELGVSLFVRTSKGMQLTREGKVLRNQAEKALSTISEIHQKAESLKDVPMGSVRLGLHIDPRFLRIDKFLSAMQRRYGKTDVHFCQRWSWQQPEDLRRGEIDAGFIYGRPANGDVAGIPLRRCNVVVAGPPEMEDRMKDADWNDIARLPWIQTPPNCIFCKIADKAFRARGLKPFSVTIADQEPIIQTLVKAGVGVSLMMEEEALALQAEGAVCAWNTVVDTIDLSFIYLKAREREPMVRSVTGIVRELWENTEKE